MPRKDKIVYNESGIWEDLPTVKLQKLVKQEDWFKGKAVVYGNKRKRHFTVPSLHIVIPYKNSTIKIEARWDEEHSKIKTTGIWNPECTWKQRTATTYNGAMALIMSHIEEQIEWIDSDFERKEQQLQKKRQFQEERKRLEKELNIKLRPDAEYASDLFNYEPSRSYKMRIGVEIDRETGNILTDEARFYIDYIEGLFTQEEIKKIIEIIGANPRAIVERLTK